MNIKEFALNHKRVLIIAVAALLVAILATLIIVKNTPEELYYDAETGFYLCYDYTGVPIPYEISTITDVLETKEQYDSKVLVYRSWEKKDQRSYQDYREDPWHRAERKYEDDGLTEEQRWQIAEWSASGLLRR